MEQTQVTTKIATRHTNKRSKVGNVVSVVGANTVIIEVVDVKQHAKYQKRYTVSRRFHAHVTGDAVAKGARVRIVETRPFSKLKRWRVVERLGNGLSDRADVSTEAPK